jgi:hypothetical protein
MISSVNIISKEEVIKALNVTILLWRSPKVEESHEVLVLTVDVTENLNWRIDSQDHWLLFKNLLTLISQGYDVLSSESKVTIAIELSIPFFRSQ